MSTRRAGAACLASAFVAVAWLGVNPMAAEGQELATRVRSMDSERISFRFETWPEIERCSGGWSRRLSREDRTRARDCWTGPAEVRMRLDGDAVRDLDVEIVRENAAPDQRWQAIGTVPPAEAATYLLDLASRAESEVAEDALGAATTANGVETWPQMLELAQDPMIDRNVRAAATFWVGQASADQVLEGLKGLVDDPDSEVRQAALFALSENQGEAAVPFLMEVAEGDADPEVRRSAFFWLSQKDDPRVLPFFERVLRGG